MKNISPHFVLDLDECAESVDGCEQVCINSVGSFSCDCNTGYDLQPDLKACQGEYFLLYSGITQEWQLGCQVSKKQRSLKI